MKKSIFTLAITMLVAGTMFTNCTSSAKKVDDARDKVEDANDKVVEANKELDQVINDTLQFRKEQQEKIDKFEKNLAEFKAKIATEKKEIKDVYDSKLLALEKTNCDLKKKLLDYKEDGKVNWQTFKAEFTHDMDELGKAINDLTVKNVK